MYDANTLRIGAWAILAVILAVPTLLIGGFLIGRGISWGVLRSIEKMRKSQKERNEDG